MRSVLPVQFLLLAAALTHAVPLVPSSTSNLPVDSKAGNRIARAPGASIHDRQVGASWTGRKWLRSVSIARDPEFSLGVKSRQDDDDFGGDDGGSDDSSDDSGFGGSGDDDFGGDVDTSGDNSGGDDSAASGDFDFGTDDSGDDTSSGDFTGLDTSDDTSADPGDTTGDDLGLGDDGAGGDNLDGDSASTDVGDSTGADDTSDDTDLSADPTDNTGDSDPSDLSGANDSTDNSDSTEPSNADGTDGSDDPDSTDATNTASSALPDASQAPSSDDSDDSDDTASNTSSASPAASQAPASSDSQPASGAAPTSSNCAASSTLPNDATVNLIKSFESFVSSPKPDPVGLLTVGFGHKCQQTNCKEVTFPFPMSQSTASQLLANDALIAVKCLHRVIPSTVTLNDNQFGALTSFTFNVGCGTFSSSTLLKRLKAGEDPNTVAAQELPKFRLSKGKVFNGLVRRRASEVQLFQTLSSVTAHPLC